MMTMDLKVQQQNLRVWITKLKLNTHRIIRSKVSDVSLSSNAKNLPLKHASSKVLKGSFNTIFLDNELESTRSDPSKEGHNVSHIIDTKHRILVLKRVTKDWCREGQSSYKWFEFSDWDFSWTYQQQDSGIRQHLNQNGIRGSDDNKT